MFPKTKEKIEAVKELPNQIRQTLALAVSALLVAFIALAFSMVGAYRAN